MKPFFDFGIIVPLKEEFKRLEALFGIKSQSVFETSLISVLDLEAYGMTAIAYLQDAMGKEAASRAASRLTSANTVGTIVLLGIAGGLASDVAVGDVCFTGDVIDILENVKVVDTAKKKGKQEFAPRFYKTPDLLTFSVSYVETGKPVASHFEDWQLKAFYAASALVKGEFLGRSGKNETIGIPEIHDGSIVCGQVSRSDAYKGDLAGLGRKLIALETEAGGVFKVAEDCATPAISIRGICDYADSNKNKLEDQTDGRLRQIAADNAVGFFQLQLKNPQFVRHVEARRAVLLNGQASLFSPVSDGTAKMLVAARRGAHEQLVSLSPDYRGKPEGYQLPLPRVRSTTATASVSPASSKPRDVSALEAIASNRITVITVPRTYPDNSLPWVLVSALTNIEIDGSQALPLAVNGEKIAPPISGLLKAGGIESTQLDSCNAAKPVFVIYDFDLDSRPRVKMLQEEMRAFPDAHFVLINRDHSLVVPETQFVLTTGPATYDVTPVSFSDISVFLQNEFAYEDAEAGVIALRLKEMFDKFKLGAHPGYFAGLGADALTSLLRANRRAELLQLAVGGFLSFVVATDKSRVSLSRTARELFLRKLAFSQRVEKRSFSRGDLVNLAEEFNRDGDFGIDAYAFVGGFVDKSIIRFTNGQAEISLPFIESYLLASELIARPDDAELYFDPLQSGLDLRTFDIYAELGPSQSVVDRVISAVAVQLQELGGAKGSDHILLTDALRPAILERPERLRQLSDRLEKAFDDVVSNRPNRNEKQQLLDLASRIEDEAREAQGQARLDESAEDQSPFERLKLPMQVWGMAAVLIGAGSERLTREPKRELANHLVSLTSVMMHELLVCFPKVEFDVIKANLLSDDGLRPAFRIPDAEPIPEDLRELAITIVEAYELSLLGFPVRSMLDFLGNAAGQPVLWNSVAQVEGRDLIEGLIANVWTSEIDASRNKGRLVEAVSRLPPTPFLRVTLSTYFMLRVFWNHWELPNRLALLDAADESMSTLGGGRMDKGRVQRMITRELTSEKDEKDEM